MIDFSTVRVVGSPARCLTFPKTAQLTHFGAFQTGIEIHTTGTATWPAISIEGKPGPEDDQAGTLWIFTRPEGPSGPWYATGAERLRPAQLNGVKPQGAADVPDTLAVLIGTGWLYDAARWGAMARYNPAVGEPVGVMVVAGSTRSDERTPLEARTQVRVIAWPAKPGENPCRVLWEEGQAVPVPPPPHPPPPPPPPPSPAVERRIMVLETLVDEQGRLLRQIADTLGAATTQLTVQAEHIQTLNNAINTRPIPTRTKPTRLTFLGSHSHDLE